VHLRADLRVSEKREALTDSGRQDGLDGYGLSLCASLGTRRCALSTFFDLIACIALLSAADCVALCADGLLL